jgi:hypothetical protein
MLWRLPGLLLRRTLRTMLLLTWLAAGAQGYGFNPLIGLTLTLGVRRWARHSWRRRGWAYQAVMRPPWWVRRLLLGPPVVAGAHMRLLEPPV